jgi:hypothetical protein
MRRAHQDGAVVLPLDDNVGRPEPYRPQPAVQKQGLCGHR